MFHYLVTFNTSIQAYNSAPFFGQRRCDSHVQGMGALKLLKSMAHVMRFQYYLCLEYTANKKDNYTNIPDSKRSSAITLY